MESILKLLANMIIKFSRICYQEKIEKKKKSNSETTLSMKIKLLYVTENA